MTNQLWSSLAEARASVIAVYRRFVSRVLTLEIYFCLLKQAFLFSALYFSLLSSLLGHSCLVFSCLQVQLLNPFLSVGPWTANCPVVLNHLSELLLDNVDLLGVCLYSFLVLFYHFR